MKTSPLLLILAFIAALALAGCSDNKIPVDEKLASAHIIPIRDARAYIKSFQDGRVRLGEMLDSAAYLTDSFDLPNAEMFNRHAIALLLNQEGAEGIRIYLGRDLKGQVRLVLLPVDKDGKDIIRKLISTNLTFIPGIPRAYADEEGEAVETGQRCPTMCD